MLDPPNLSHILPCSIIRSTQLNSNSIHRATYSVRGTSAEGIVPQDPCSATELASWAQEEAIAALPAITEHQKKGVSPVKIASGISVKLLSKYYGWNTIFFKHVKSNANAFIRAHTYKVFLTLCVRINLGGTPRFIPPHSIWKTYTNSAPYIVTLISGVRGSASW